MKIFPKQGVCPHCDTVYRYADMKALMWKKEERCYHCQKTFRISRKGFVFLALELIIIYAVMNSIAIGVTGTVSFAALFVMNVIPVAAAVLMMPLYIELKQHQHKDK